MSPQAEQRAGQVLMAVAISCGLLFAQVPWWHAVTWAAPVLVLVMLGRCERRASARFLDAGLKVVIGLALTVMTGSLLVATGTGVITAYLLGWRRWPIMVLVAMAYPWLADLAVIAHLSQVSAAAVTAGVYGWAGWPAERVGTWLQVGQQPVQISEACAGLELVRWMLLLGAMAALRGSHRSLLTPMVVVATAWILNVVRVIVLVAAVLWFGPEHADSIHQWLNPLVTVSGLMLAVLLARWLPTRDAISRHVLVLAQVTAAFFIIPGLLAHWQHNPLDRAGWILALIWLVMVGVVWCRHGCRVPRELPLIIGIIASCIGAIASLNILCHVGVLIALTAWYRTLWLGSACAVAGLIWLPALSYVFAEIPKTGFGLRILVALLPVLLCWYQTRNASDRLEPPVRWSAGIVVIALVAVWGLLPMAPDRRAGLLPAIDLGQPLTLSAHEQAAYRDIEVIRQVAVIDAQALAFTVVDGTANRHAVHDPWYCAHAAGWQVSARESHPVPGGHAGQVRISDGDQMAWLTWWYTDGEQRWADLRTYTWQTSLRRLCRGWGVNEPYLVICQSREGRPIPATLFARLPQLCHL